MHAIAQGLAARRHTSQASAPLLMPVPTEAEATLNPAAKRTRRLQADQHDGRNRKSPQTGCPLAERAQIAESVLMEQVIFGAVRLRPTSNYARSWRMPSICWPPAVSDLLIIVECHLDYFSCWPREAHWRCGPVVTVMTGRAQARQASSSRISKDLGSLYTS
jgi:hypothetical protein